MRLSSVLHPTSSSSVILCSDTFQVCVWYVVSSLAADCAILVWVWYVLSSPAADCATLVWVWYVLSSPAADCATPVWVWYVVSSPAADCASLVWVWCVVPSPAPADHLDNSRGWAAGHWATAVRHEVRAYPGEPAAHEEHQGDVQPPEEPVPPCGAQLHQGAPFACSLSCWSSGQPPLAATFAQE